MRRKRRFWGILILAVILDGAFSACRKNPPEAVVFPGAKACDLRLETSVFKTKTGRNRADQGALIVPENREKPDSRLIALPIVRIRAEAAKPDEPIFYLAGGPGQSNLKFRPPDELLARHDFVLVGYRGVDGSSRLDCPEVRRAIKGVGGDILGASSLAALKGAFEGCAARLQGEGADLDAYTMLDVVRDLEMARTALGYERIDLLSQSYGTRVAQIYAHHFPETIRRSVMIGVNPPGHFVWEAGTIDRQLEYYARLWERDEKARARSSGLVQTMRNVIRDMPRRWLFIPIDRGKVKLISFALLYHRKTAAQVFDAYVAAEGGDASGLALMSLAYDLMFPKMIIWGDLIAKAASADFDPKRDYALEMDPPGSILGSPFSKLLWSVAAWPTAPLPEDDRRPQPSSVETLLVGGSIDFSTPAENATRELLPLLSRGKQVILAEMGHTGDFWNVDRPAAIRLLSTFFDTGVADDSAFAYVPMDFHVAWGFPLLAKAGLGLGALIILALVGSPWLIRRRIRRRKARRASVRSS